MGLSFQRYGKRHGASEYFDTYLLAQGLDNTTPIYGPVIDNNDGRVRAIFAQLVVRNAGGIDPKLELMLCGKIALDETPLLCLYDDHGRAMKSSALAIQSAFEKPLSVFLDSEAFSRQYYPPHISVGICLTGKKPSWTGHVAVSVVRQF